MAVKMNYFTCAKKGSVGLKAFFERLTTYYVYSQKRKLTSLKCEEKCSSIEKFLFSGHVLGKKLVMGQRTSLFSLNHLVKTDKEDNIFLRQSQATGVPAFRQNLC